MLIFPTRPSVKAAVPWSMVSPYPTAMVIIKCIFSHVTSIWIDQRNMEQTYNILVTFNVVNRGHCVPISEINGQYVTGLSETRQIDAQVVNSFKKDIISPVRMQPIYVLQ